MQVFKGIVTNLRTVAITHVQSNMSAVKHETTIKFGEHSLILKTRSSPAIHLGDELRVYGSSMLGSVKPMLLLNSSNGYEAGFANRLSIAATGVLGVSLVVWAMHSQVPAVAAIGVLCLVACAGVAVARRLALDAIRAA